MRSQPVLVARSRLSYYSLGSMALKALDGLPADGSRLFED